MSQAANGKTCHDCRYWKHIHDGDGHCRRNPPTILESMVFQELRCGAGPLAKVLAEATHFPTTYEEDWCGAFERPFGLEPVTDR